MAVALDQVLKQLADSGIIDSGKLSNFIPPKSQPKDAEELARELVKQNHLTKFQAQQILAGRVKALILGNYTLLDKIGAGGMGQVFKAEHRRMKRLVAIKMLPNALVKDAAALARFQREVEAAAKLSHSNIVAAHDADEANGVHFLVMEFVAGRDLSAIVKKDGPLPVGKALDYIRQAACGLAFAHKKGVVHRDIKPANLLLDDEGTVKILDMGLARIEGDGPAQAELTGTGAVMGTVDYMAPEQALSTKHADARADIYSLGCSLYYLVTGSPVYEGETITAKLIAHQSHPIPSLKDVVGVPPPLDAIFQRMIAKRIDDRYQTMTDVVADLENCLAGLTGGASSASATWSSGATISPADLSIALSNSPLRSLDAPESPQIKVEPKPARTKASHGRKPVGSGAPPWFKNRKIIAAAGGAWLFVLVLGIVVVIRNKQGHEVARLKVPPGGSVEVATSGSHKAPDSLDTGASGFFGQAKKITTYNDPAFKKWMAGVMVMSAEKQIDAVREKLKELNPNFDGKLTECKKSSGSLVGPPKIENGVVTELAFRADGVLDLSPLRALRKLKVLWCEGTATGAPLCDLSPLEGMQLTHLSLFNTSVVDLSPLKGMPLAMLAFQVTPVADLSPLRGMPLTELNCSTTRVSDLAPIREAKLTRLRCYGSRISDLSPLTGMPLTSLYCSALPITDITPLAGMPLELLWIERTLVADYSPLEKCKSLKALKISKDRLTADQVATLEKALPKCKFEWEGGTGSSLAPGESPGAIGASGFALDFSPERKSYVEVPEWQYDGKTPLTVEAWITPRTLPSTDLGSSVNIVGNRARSGFGLALSTTSHQWVFSFDEKSGLQTCRDQLRKASVNERAHVAGVFSRNEIRLYVNGQRVSEAPIEPPHPPSAGMTKIGGTTINGFFDGTIDEVRISTVARYTEDFTPQQRFEPDANTEVLYHFDEGSGTVANDASPHHCDGKISGATWIASSASGVATSEAVAAPMPAVAPFDAQQARSHQQAWAAYLGLPPEFNNSIGMRFALIPPGEFVMGGDDPDAQPKHRVRITRPFYFGVTEMMQLQLKRIDPSAEQRFAFAPTGTYAAIVVGQNTNYFPAEPMDRTLALTAVDKLNQIAAELQTGRTYRLPTESEWEYACRAGTTTRYWFGDDDDQLNVYGWLRANADNRTHPVSQKAANPFGLFDLYGNVAECCSDWYAADGYARSTVDDPTGPESGDANVLRGSSFGSEQASSSLRGVRTVASGPDGSAGIRMVCDIVLTAAQRAAIVSAFATATRAP